MVKKPLRPTITDKEILAAQDIPLSDYAVYHLDLSGYDFKYKGVFIPRFLLWHNGYRNADALIENKTDIKAIQRPAFVKESYSYN